MENLFVGYLKKIIIKNISDNIAKLGILGGSLGESLRFEFSDIEKSITILGTKKIQGFYKTCNY